MVQCVRKEDFRLVEIDKEFQKDFVAKDTHELSDMESYLLKLVGNVLRGPKSQNFWNSGCFTWWEDERQSHEQRVFLTHNGILIFEDCKLGKMFRVLER